MAAETPNPVLRGRIEAAIRVAAPVLDLLLAVAERAARLLERDDPAYVPARMRSDSESAPRGLRPRP
jgi:hypothetical protein